MYIELERQYKTTQTVVPLGQTVRAYHHGALCMYMYKYIEDCCDCWRKNINCIVCAVWNGRLFEAAWPACRCARVPVN